jgi:ligand-binding sensor domain-containing protein
MVKIKDNKTAVITAIVFLAALVAISSVSAGEWEIFTSTSQVRYLDYFNDSLQVVTSGGLLIIDPVTSGFRKVINTDGLGTNNLYHIIKDSNDAVWMAGYGRLIKYADGAYTPYLFYDRNDNLLTLYSLADDGDYLWVGTSSGLALFSKSADGGQIDDFYYRFGDFNPEPVVNDLLIVGDTIWMATSSGLAMADKSDPRQLKSYVNWETFNTSNFPELTVDTVTAVVRFHDKIYIGTTRDVFRLTIGGNDTSFTDIATRSPISVKDMRVEGDSLFIYATGGFFIYTETGISWNSTPTTPNYNFASGKFIDGTHWLGMLRYGLYIGVDNIYTKFNDGGLISNNVTAFSFSSSGRPGVCFGSDGVALYDSTGWNKLNVAIRDVVTSSFQDINNNIWVGTWGNGAFKVSPETTINYDENNSSLRGVLEGPTYVVVRGFALSSNYLFMICYRALDGNPVAVVDLNDETRWESFGFSDSITTDRLNSIACNGNALALGTENNGVFYYYFGPDPFDKADDSTVNYREDNSWLGSNNVNIVKFDNQGILWVGTKYGLSRYDPGIDKFIDIVLPDGFGPEVTGLAFDRRGNIWMGSHSGLAYYNSDTRSIDIYNILNSGLTDNEITALGINTATSDLWVGTPSGISVLTSIFGRSTSDITNVIAFPNPFIIREGETLSFNYNGEAMVRIYTVAGELVREMSINVAWDGINQNGGKVATGVYLFLLTAPDGSVGRGKILLVRE